MQDEITIENKNIKNANAKNANDKNVSVENANEDTVEAGEEGASQHAMIEDGHEARPAQPVRYTYMDCLRGITPVPKGTNGATIFMVLMVGGMVTFMVTVNGIRNTGLDFLVHSHWLYPLVFCIAFLVRVLFAARVVDFIAPRVVLNHFEGIPRSIAMTVLNVCIMAPIMGAIVTLLLTGTDNFLMTYLTTLPITMPTAMLINFFAIGPAVKLIFNNVLSPSGGLGLLSNLSENTSTLTRLLGC